MIAVTIILPFMGVVLFWFCVAVLAFYLTIAGRKKLAFAILVAVLLVWFAISAWFIGRIASEILGAIWITALLGAGAGVSLLAYARRT